MTCDTAIEPVEGTPEVILGVGEGECLAPLLLFGAALAGLGLQLGEDDPAAADQREIGEAGLGPLAVVRVVDQPALQLGQLDHHHLQVSLTHRLGLLETRRLGRERLPLPDGHWRTRSPFQAGRTAHSATPDRLVRTYQTRRRPYRPRPASPAWSPRPS